MKHPVFVPLNYRSSLYSSPLQYCAAAQKDVEFGLVKAREINRPKYKYLSSLQFLHFNFLPFYSRPHCKSVFDASLAIIRLEGPQPKLNINSRLD